MEILDSRRLTGPNLLCDRPGAIVDVSLAGNDPARVLAIWKRQARRILDAVGWEGEQTFARLFEGGANLAISAPIDALYAATEVAEWAWGATCALLADPPAMEDQPPPAVGKPPPPPPAVGGAATGGRGGTGGREVDEAASRLRTTIEAERNPALLALRDAAANRKLTFFSDDEHVSVGMGKGSLSWPVETIPRVDQVEWASVADIPVALVTGTNGKTTTVRLIAAMAQAADMTPGVTSTDWIRAGDEILERGDYSGPGGARTVLRDRRIDVAVLETARGGMLRRGLAITRADVVAITNVADDHLGEFGVANLDSLIDAKWIVTQASSYGGRVVLNADDGALVRRALGHSAPITWCTLGSAESDLLGKHLAAEGEACYLDSGTIVYARGHHRTRLLNVKEIPFTFGGAARHNIANALVAVAVAVGLGIPIHAIVEALRAFAGNADDNPGRGNIHEIGQVTMLIDFAHNPHGMEAIMELVAALPARRRLVIVGQSGDRDDRAIRDLVGVIWRTPPDRIILKDLPHHLRGRQPGDVPALMKRELMDLGAGEELIGEADSEIEAVRAALEWSQPGDLLLMLIHENRNAVMDLLSELKQAGWCPGTPLPK